MARLARIEYPGAIYHVINRGNYRRDVFATVGAAHSFVKTLQEAVTRFEWKLGAYVVMRNHFHLAVRTPQPNLSAGMQWLQVTFATRFNRMRNEQGHLFQGRFKALNLQDENVWARVADYIHLNPLRAHVVEPEQLVGFRWSSLTRFVRNQKFTGLTASEWLATKGWDDSAEGWMDYSQELIEKYEAEQGVPKDKRTSLSVGWAIGDADWKNKLLEDVANSTREENKAEYQEPKVLQKLRWKRRLAELLVEAGRTEADLEQRGRGAKWKVQLADKLQREMGVPVVWIAEELKWRKAASVRTSLCRYRNVDKVTT